MRPFKAGTLEGTLNSGTPASLLRALWELPRYMGGGRIDRLYVYICMYINRNRFCKVVGFGGLS